VISYDGIILGAGHNRLTAVACLGLTGRKGLGARVRGSCWRRCRLGPGLPGATSAAFTALTAFWSPCGRRLKPAISSMTMTFGGRWCSCPLDEVLRSTFAKDAICGIVATDALLGAIAHLDGESLPQNICFFYHLIGNGTGDWDDPIGGMGAVTTPVQLLRSRLRRLRDTSVDPRAAFAGTFHTNEGFTQLQRTYAAAAAGSMPGHGAVRDLLPLLVGSEHSGI